MNEEAELAHKLAVLLGCPSVSAMMSSMSSSEWDAWREFLRGNPDLLAVLAERDEFRQKLREVVDEAQVKTEGEDFLSKCYRPELVSEEPGARSGQIFAVCLALAFILFGVYLVLSHA